MTLILIDQVTKAVLGTQALGRGARRALNAETYDVTVEVNCPGGGAVVEGGGGVVLLTKGVDRLDGGLRDLLRPLFVALGGCRLAVGVGGDVSQL